MNDARKERASRERRLTQFVKSRSRSRDRTNTKKIAMMESKPNAVGGARIETDQTPRGTVSQGSNTTAMMQRLLSANDVVNAKADLEEPIRNISIVPTSRLNATEATKRSELTQPRARQGTDTPDMRYNKTF